MINGANSKCSLCRQWTPFILLHGPTLCLTHTLWIATDPGEHTLQRPQTSVHRLACPQTFAVDATRIGNLIRPRSLVRPFLQSLQQSGALCMPHTPDRSVLVLPPLFGAVGVCTQCAPFSMCDSPPSKLATYFFVWDFVCMFLGWVVQRCVKKQCWKRSGAQTKLFNKLYAAEAHRNRPKCAHT